MSCAIFTYLSLPFYDGQHLTLLSVFGAHYTEFPFLNWLQAVSGVLLFLIQKITKRLETVAVQTIVDPIRML